MKNPQISYVVWITSAIFTFNCNNFWIFPQGNDLCSKTEFPELGCLTGTDENLDRYGNGRFEPKIVITSNLNDF